MKDEQKLSFWKKIKISITDFEKYQDLAAERVIKTIGYIALIMLIFNIVVAGIYTYKFSATISNIRGYIEENIAQITFEEAKLTVIPKNKEKITTIKNEESKITVIINTQNSNEKELQKSIDEFNGIENAILILPNKIMLKNGLIKQPYSYSYENISNQYNINKLDKQEVLNLLSIDTIKQVLIYVYIVMFIYMFIMYFSSALIDIIMLSVLGYIVTIIAKIRIRYSAIYNIAAYAITLPVILNLVYFVVNAFTGFTIKYFEVMYTGIASIYIITAILIIKSDVIKRQIELEKIIQEQEKVKLELQQKEEEKKEREERERQKKEDEEKNNQDDNRKKDKNKTKKEEDLDAGSQPSMVERKEQNGKGMVN